MTAEPEMANTPILREGEASQTPTQVPSQPSLPSDSSVEYVTLVVTPYERPESSGKQFPRELTVLLMETSLVHTIPGTGYATHFYQDMSNPYLFYRLTTCPYNEPGAAGTQYTANRANFSMVKPYTEKEGYMFRRLCKEVRGHILLVNESQHDPELVQWASTRPNLLTYCERICLYAEPKSTNGTIKLGSEFMSQAMSSFQKHHQLPGFAHLTYIPFETPFLYIGTHLVPKVPDTLTACNAFSRAVMSELTKMARYTSSHFVAGGWVHNQYSTRHPDDVKEYGRSPRRRQHDEDAKRLWAKILDFWGWEPDPEAFVQEYRVFTGWRSMEEAAYVGKSMWAGWLDAWRMGWMTKEIAPANPRVMGTVHGLWLRRLI